MLLLASKVNASSILYHWLVFSAEESEPICAGVVSSHSSSVRLELSLIDSLSAVLASRITKMLSRASVLEAIYR